jgi:glycosyltransferase involved in cell wall biosynthesis
MGEGAKKANLIRYVKTLKIEDIVFFHEWIPQQKIPLYYSASDIFVFPSLVEPFGRVIPEAMACKVPAIGTNIGGIPEQVKDRKTGLLVPPADSETLALKI